MSTSDCGTSMSEAIGTSATKANASKTSACPASCFVKFATDKLDWGASLWTPRASWPLLRRCFHIIAKSNLVKRKCDYKWRRQPLAELAGAELTQNETKYETGV